MKSIVINIVLLVIAITTKAQYINPLVSSGACEQNVYCTSSFNLSSEAKNNIARAVVLYKTSAGWTCSGTILAKENNSNPNPDYYLLTARHCIHNDLTSGPLAAGMGLGSPISLSSVNIYFNASNPCIGSSPNPTPADTYSINTSLTLVEKSLTNDMALLKINTPVPPQAKPYFAGWSASLFNTNTFSGDFYIIHHPSSDVKKASMAHWYDVYDGSVAVTSAFLAAPWFGAAASSGLTDKIYADLDVANGLLEEGSSGSCLINGNDKVIGTTSWGINGYSACNNGSRAAAFGKFRKFFLGNSNVRNALGVSLPQVSLSGKELTCYSDLLNLSGTYYPANNYQPNNHIALNSANNLSTQGSLTIKNGADFTFTAANEIVLKPGFRAESGVEFHAKIEPCQNLNYRPMEEFMTSVDSLYMDSLILNNITPFREDSAAWFNIMQEFYPDIFQNQDSLELYWNYLGYGSLNNNMGARSANISNNNKYEITDYKISDKLPHIKIYPNPNNGEFKIVLSETPSSVSVVNPLGIVVYENKQISANEINVNLKDVAKGLYIVKVNCNGKVLSKKIVID